MAIGAGDRSGREHIESSAPVTSAHQGSSSRIASEAIARLDLSLFHLGDATASGDISHRPGTATKAFGMVELAAPRPLSELGVDNDHVLYVRYRLPPEEGVSFGCCFAWC